MYAWLDIEGNEDKLEVFLESCQKIIKQNGLCEGIFCKDCPGNFPIGGICTDSFCNKCERGVYRPTKINSAKLFIETHGGKKMLKREKLMKFVADELGVKLDEKFNVYNDPYNPYIITGTGVFDGEGNVDISVICDKIIEKIPTKYTVIIDGKEYEVSDEQKNVILNGIKG